MSALIDKRWESIVRVQFDDLVQVLDPDSFLDRLFRKKLVTKEEYHRLRSMPSREEKSRALLSDILPRKGETSYDQFVTIVRETEGQEHVVKVLGGERRSSAVGEEKNEWEKKLEESESRRAESEKKLAESEKKRRESEKRHAETEKKHADSEKKKNAKLELTNIGLRNKIGRGDGGHLKWKQFAPNIGCLPHGCVAEINGMIHVGWQNRMFQLKEGAWKGEKHDLGFKIGSVFECEGKGYVMERGGFYGDQCKRIYEWKSESRDLELLTQIPHEYQLDHRSAIGHNGNIYLVGGWRSDRVDHFDINKGEWEPIKKMKKGRYRCSLAVIDDKMFVGGGAGAGLNSVECFLMKEQKWIDINPTTEYRCQLSSWNGKLVATGGWGCSNCVELYDELSGDWLPLPSMNEGRDLHGACETKDNQLVVVGGWGAKNSLECLKL